MAFFCVSCGSTVESLFDETVVTGVDPYVNRVEPATAAAGDTVTIFGMGFSSVKSFNVVIVNGVEALADSYSLLATPQQYELESITFTVPAGIAAGSQPVYVDVLDNISNTNISLTIN